MTPRKKGGKKKKSLRIPSLDCWQRHHCPSDLVKIIDVVVEDGKMCWSALGGWYIEGIFRFRIFISFCLCLVGCVCSVRVKGLTEEEMWAAAASLPGEGGWSERLSTE